MTIRDWRMAQTPFAVLDIETTGANAGLDRIVEISVIRLNPQSAKPEVAFDTLLNPRCPVTLTEVHGISQSDITDAPTFDAVAALLVAAISDAVIVAHNAYFDIRFLRAELGRVGVDFEAPYLCTMLLRPLLGMGSAVSLEQQCKQHGIQIGDGPHVASVDATATAFMMLRYMREFQTKGIATFSDLAARGAPTKYPFLASFAAAPLNATAVSGLPVPTTTKSRADKPTVEHFGTGAHVAVRREDYLSAVMNALSDFHLSDHELSYLTQLREQQNLTDGQVRAAHARVYTYLLTAVSQDGVIDEQERAGLCCLVGLLRQLGWAPGD